MKYGKVCQSGPPLNRPTRDVALHLELFQAAEKKPEMVTNLIPIAIRAAELVLDILNSFADKSQWTLKQSCPVSFILSHSM